MTHIIHFTLEPIQTPPYYTLNSPSIEADSDGSGISDQVELLNHAHANDVKVILCLGGVGGVNDTNLTYVTSTDVLAQAFVNSVLSYARSKGYDGVDVDWEFPDSVDRPNFIRLMTKLRAGLDAWPTRGLLTISVATYASWKGYDVPALNATADQVNLMTYDMAKDFSTTGFNSPIRKPTSYPSYTSYDIDQRFLKSSPDGWLTRGLQRGKIGIGLPFYGMRCNGNTAPGQSRVCTTTMMSYKDVLPLQTEAGSTVYWDSEAEVPWIGNPSKDYFISYDDEASITAKVNFVHEENLGGVMIWELWWDRITSGGKPYSHPLLQAAGTAAGR